MNIIECDLVKEGDKYGVKLEGVDSNIVWLKKNTGRQIENSGLDFEKKYLFGIRPDHVKVTEKGIPAHVEAVEQLGDETIIYATIENHKQHIVVKAPLTININSQDDIHLEFLKERVYLFDKDSEYSLIGMPSFNKIPCSLKDNKIVVGSQEVELDEEYVSHILDRAFNEPIFMAIKPEHIELEGNESNRELKTKVEFIEERTNYNIVYVSLEGVNQYLTFRASKERKYNEGDKVSVYLPLDKTYIFDKDDDSLYCREVAYKNTANATVSHDKDGNVVISIQGGEKLVYSKEELPDVVDGNYEFVLKQDGCQVVFNKKVAKKMKEKPLTIVNKGKYLTVSCYDEEPQHKTNTVFAKINGFNEYVTFVVENNFSVYKMPKFKIQVPANGFELNKK